MEDRLPVPEIREAIRERIDSLRKALLRADLPELDKPKNQKQAREIVDAYHRWINEVQTERGTDGFGKLPAKSKQGGLLGLLGTETLLGKPPEHLRENRISGWQSIKELSERKNAEIVSRWVVESDDPYELGIADTIRMAYVSARTQGLQLCAWFADTLEAWEDALIPCIEVERGELSHGQRLAWVSLANRTEQRLIKNSTYHALSDLVSNGVKQFDNRTQLARFHEDLPALRGLLEMVANTGKGKVVRRINKRVRDRIIFLNESETS